MTEFFEDPNFVKIFNKCTYEPHIILQIMKEIKETNPDLNIDVFNCILDKIIDPTTSHTRYSDRLYIHSISVWNNYIYKNNKTNLKCNFNLLIGYEELCL